MDKRKCYNFPYCVLFWTLPEKLKFPNPISYFPVNPFPLFITLDKLEMVNLTTSHNYGPNTASISPGMELRLCQDKQQVSYQENNICG